MVDLVIKNGLVVTPGGTIRGGLAVSDGRIVQIGDDTALLGARCQVDAEGNFVLPGAIDPHTHLHTTGDEVMPFFSQGIKTESISAAVNGITTVVSTPFMSLPPHMPRQLPKLKEERETASQSSFVDFKFNVVVLTDTHISEMTEMTREGFNSFKLFMGF